MKFISMVVLALATMAGDPVGISEQTLHIAKQIPVRGEVARAMVAPFRCDSSGNLYFRYYEGKSKVMPIHSVAPDGTVRATFAVNPATAQVDGVQTDDFFVSADGTVYQLGWRGAETYIFVFDKKGEYKSKVKLETNIAVFHVAPFPSGEFLVDGLEPGTPDNPKQNAPRTGLVDSNGKFVKLITFQDDEQLKRAAEGGDSQLTASGGVRNLAVTLGMAAPAEDGNVYLMRRSSPATIYAISPAGEVQNTITVDPGEPQLEPTSIQVHGRSLVVQFYDGAKKTLYKVVSLPAGDPLATYVGGVGMGAALSCYDGSSLTFLSQKSGNLSVVRAEP